MKKQGSAKRCILSVGSGIVIGVAFCVLSNWRFFFSPETLMDYVGIFFLGFVTGFGFVEGVQEEERQSRYWVSYGLAVITVVVVRLIGDQFVQNQNLLVTLIVQNVPIMRTLSVQEPIQPPPLWVYMMTQALTSSLVFIVAYDTSWTKAFNQAITAIIGFAAVLFFLAFTIFGSSWSTKLACGLSTVALMIYFDRRLRYMSGPSRRGHSSRKVIRP